MRAAPCCGPWVRDDSMVATRGVLSTCVRRTPNTCRSCLVSVSWSFRTFVIDQLSRVIPRVRARSMFGGVGIYAGDRFFALIADDTLYLKVDAWDHAAQLVDRSEEHTSEL